MYQEVCEDEEPRFDMLSLQKTYKQATPAKEVTENQRGLFLLYQSIANITVLINYNYNLN